MSGDDDVLLGRAELERAFRASVCSRPTAARLRAHGEGGSRKAAIADLRQALIGLTAELSALKDSL